MRGRGSGPIQSSQRVMQTFYDQNANAYREANSVMHDNLKQLAAALTRNLDLGSTILDVGCAHGRDMAYFESQGYNTVGIDISPKLLEIAKQKVRGEVYCTDMTRLPLKDSSVDAVWSIASAMHLTKADFPRALAEFRRVLGSENLVLSIKAGAGEGFENGGSMQGQRYFARYSQEELSSYLKTAGFDDFKLIYQEGLYDSWITSVPQNFDIS